MKSRTAGTETFASHDGSPLFYRHWPALGRRARGGIVLLHRGHEHSGRLAHVAHELGLPEFDVFAWDARGHGRSAGRGRAPAGAGAMVRDLQCFIEHIGRSHGHQADAIVIVGQSMGALLAAAWVHDYAPGLRGLVLAAPAFRIDLKVPFALPALKAWQKLRGEFPVTSFVRGRHLTRDPHRAAAYDNDPLVVRPISSRLLIGVHELGARIVADAAAITVPTQLLVSGSDPVVRAAPQHRFFDSLGATVKERHILPGFRHDALSERDREPVMEAVRAFILARFGEAPHRPQLLDADKRGFTFDEAAELARPLPIFSLRGLYWRARRAALAFAGLLSRGIALGHARGFDSGATLDYVYRNRPQGRGLLGRAIDRAYLDAVGWKGIRRRKVHVEEMIGTAMRAVKTRGRPARILDIAAGHGRYVLDAVAGDGPAPDALILRDWDEWNVAAGNRLIAERGLSGIADFSRGDAFDTAALAAISPQPTIGVVSGLYELFPDNGPVGDSLRGLAAAIPPGGYLVYTGQPWHPQIELIARCLTSHRDGASWVMRRRTQAELDQLVAAAGFTKIDQRVDEWGIFTVSLARRNAGDRAGVS